jgi:CO dehydrogenase/acetyl-CoA synthase delta subunit
MKLLLALFALVSFGLFVPNMYADGLDLTIGGQVHTVVATPVAGGEEFLFTATNLGVLTAGDVVSLYNINFDATLLDVGGPQGIKSLTVAETCATVYLGFNPISCSQDVSFLYTNDQLGNLLGVVGQLNIGADINADAGIIDAGLDIGGGNAVFTYSNPPAPPAAAPEPGTLSLMGTGLLGVAGVIRRKFRAV